MVEKKQGEYSTTTTFKAIFASLLEAEKDWTSFVDSAYWLRYNLQYMDVLCTTLFAVICLKNTKNYFTVYKFWFLYALKTRCTENSKQIFPEMKLPRS